VNPISFYNHLPLQQKFHNDESKVKGIFGGNRAGKTEEGSEYVISKCLAKPKQRWWASAETFQDSVNIQQRKVWDLVPKNRLKYGRYDEINGFTNRKLLFDNGSMILFKSYDQGRESFASDDVDGIWNDEEPPYDIYKEQRMRLIDRNGEMIFTMTSLKGITDLIQDLFEDHDVIESAFAPLVKKELPRIVNKNGMRFYMLWTPENPHIDQKRVLEEVKLMPTDEIMARIYGLPINLSGKIYMAFNKGVHVIPFENLPDLKDCTLYHILDPHDRKPWAMIWVAVHKTGTCYVIDEYPNRNFNEMLYDDKTYDDYAALIRDKEDALLACGCNRIYKRILDPNFGNKTVQLAERQGGQSKTTPKEELKKRGLKFIDGIDSIEAGHLKVREFLHYEKKDGEIVVQPKIFFTDNCENAIRHHSRYSRKDILDNSGDVKNKVNPQEKYKDFCDLTRYFTMSNPRHESESPMPKTAPTADRIY
jgi:phage terminase large subunit-like protein